MAAELTNRAVAEAMGWRQDPVHLDRSQPPWWQRGEQVVRGCPAYLSDHSLLGEMLDWLIHRGHTVTLYSDECGSTAATDHIASVDYRTQKAVAALVVAVKEASA